MESRYEWPEGESEKYRQLLNQADSKIDWRYRIARWMLRVADEFMLKRDTGMRDCDYNLPQLNLLPADSHVPFPNPCIIITKALIALSYFDRMMMSSQNELERDQFQVAAITCLFLASKIFQKRPLKVSSVSLNYSLSLLLLSIFALSLSVLTNEATHTPTCQNR